MAHQRDDVWGGRSVFCWWNCCTIPTMGNLQGRIFSFLPEPNWALIVVKLLISHWFHGSRKTAQWWPRKQYAEGHRPFGCLGFIKSMLLEGLVAPPPWWWWFVVVCSGLCWCLIWLSSVVVCKEVWENNLTGRVLCVTLCPTHACAPYHPDKYYSCV